MTDPRRAISTLTDDLPFLLLPLRLETRFVGHELLMRAFPDDISIVAHETAVTERELADGRAFWTAISGQPDARASAWRTLAAGRVPSRAAWIVRATQPPNQPQLKTEAWSQPPHAALFPDQLEFSLFTGDRIVHRQLGTEIPKPLVVGPDPSVPIERHADGSLELPPEAQWIVDFERALAHGMAVRIQITAEEAATGFDRLVVLGIVVAEPAATGSKLAELVRDHAYSDGLMIVPQGTPTNHTADEPAGRTSEELDAMIARELDPVASPPADPSTRDDATRLAAALGLPTDGLARLRNAGTHDIAEAIAMQRLLWPATLGYFLEHMMSPTVTPDTRARVRALFTQHVLGRGSLPAIAAGVQPYGIVVTTAFSNWSPSDPFEADLDRTARITSAKWHELVPGVARAGTGNDGERALLDVLGLHASSIAFDTRRGVGGDVRWNLDAFEGVDPAARQAAHVATATQLAAALGHAMPQLPRVLDLAFMATHARMTRPIVDGLPPSEVRVLDPNYLEWLRGSIDLVRTEQFGGAVPTALLYVIARQAILIGAWDAGVRLLVANGLADDSIRREAELVNVRAANELTRWDHLHARIPALSATLSVGDLVRDPLVATNPAVADHREQLAALATLAPLPTARLERLFTEHVDLCSYRLDAWRLALVDRRLEAMRSKHPHDLHAGAYGYLEQIRPAARGAGTGFVHAPSLDHATTAAVLRSAYNAHHDPSARERMAIDLSSERVRRALSYLDGIRQGQTLGALLGYRFERGLHDADASLLLDRFIFEIRAAFPSAAAERVVDGIRLVSARSQGYPYGVAGLPAASSTEGKAIIAQIDRIADDLDAIADLYLAEAVYQAVRGNHDRAAAITNGLLQGAPPPDLEVIRTPRSGLAVTHRVCISFPEGTPHPWPATPRARFEPQLDRWLGALLGPPSTIAVRLRAGTRAFDITLDALGASPLDLVYAFAGNARRLPPELARLLVARVRDREGLGAEVALDVAWSERAGARTLFELAPLLASAYTIVRARPLHAGDLATTADRRQDAGELAARLDGTLADLGAALTAGGAALDEWLAATATSASALTSLHARAVDAHVAAGTDLDRLVAATRLVFGDAFNPLPRFSCGNAAELASAIDAPALGVDPFAVREWLEGVARVRPALAAYENVRLFAELFERTESPMHVAQLPFIATARWLGLPLTPASPNGCAVSLVLDGRFDASTRVGVVLDEIVDVIPSEHEVTGVAFHHDRPQSEPPQAVLLVVPPVHRGGWQWTDLHAAVIETVELAKQRAVEPDALAHTPYGQFLPAILAPVSDAPVTFSLDLEMTS